MNNAFAQQDRLSGFALSLSQAEHRIEKRRSARQAGQDGAEPYFGVRAEAHLQNAIRRYEQIVKAGGWRVVAEGKPLRPGDSDKRVSAIRHHLTATGDFDAKDAASNGQFDQTLLDAVIRFQTRHGLPNEGYLGNLTLAAMNVRADVRLGQLRTNLERMRRFGNGSGAERSVVVNIPAYELLALNGDQVAFSSRVIVGRVDRKTPEVSA